jgi:UDP-GlcNAc:undecaprenyl-phosphate GlcNAc-1-phosphate transferase
MGCAVDDRTCLNMVVLAGLLAVLVTLAAVPVCIVAARRFGVIDRPGHLKTQESPVPYLGGVAVFAGLVVGAVTGRPVALIPLAAALVVGVADDRFGLPVRFRLVAQLAVGLLVAVAVPTHLPGPIGVPLVVATSLVLINGFNLLDGLDMLAAGVAAAAAVGFAVLTGGAARLLAASLAGALTAFLGYNRPPARIYLGDGGSYLLGAAMTVLLADTWGVGVAVSTGVIALALLVVPVAEVASAVVRRHRSGLALMAGDRAHPYDLLVTRGWSRLAASGAYIGLEVLIVLVVCIAFGLGDSSLALALAVDVAAVTVTMAAASRVGGFSPSNGACS